jgi:hypothetical protein
MDIVSQFADRERTENILANNEMLRRFANEFCYEFGTKVMELKDFSDRYPNNQLRILTARGMDAGTISIARHNGENENHYNVTMPTVINKGKASRRSDKGARDSDKLTTLFRALRKNKEEPTDEKLINVFRTHINYALSRVDNRETPQINVSQGVTLATVKMALGIDNGEVQFYSDEIKSAYAKYMKAKEKSDAGKSDRARFNKGFHVVGIMNANRYNAHYIVTEGHCGVEKDETKVVLQPTLTRYTSLADSPLAVTAMLIRTYGEGKQWDGDDIDIKLPWRDTYYSDIDVATGYSGRGEGLWLVIPKYAE